MRVLGKTGLKINEIGFGGIPIQKLTQEQVNNLFEALEKTGVNFIDTARGYTNSEELIGLAICEKREKFVLATKSMARTYEKMKKDIDVSLKNLKTNFIDLYQLHNVQEGENYEGALKALCEAKLEGKVKHIGITTHSVDLLKKIVDSSEFETIQFPYNIIERQAEQCFEIAKLKNIGVIVMKPLAGGAIDNAKVAIKFVLNNDNVSVVIPGMDAAEQVYENTSVKGGRYSEEELEIIEDIKKSLNDNFCRRCGYCMPCPVGINIPLTFLCEGYYERYGLQEWAKERYTSMNVNPNQCLACGMCEKKCPYKLNIREKLKKVVKMMEIEDGK